MYAAYNYCILFIYQTAGPWSQNEHNERQSRERGAHGHQLQRRFGRGQQQGRHAQHGGQGHARSHQAAE